ncbi:nucleoside recognition domain-containing protein [Sporomusa acidovorans]|uniref:Nucleoside transporter/FeoB GTPase Gate domain-containing protein n=1 Tax=Sporomusa acidovorans (strain ATCC 49682 / DSM 3132 / Mol) TaxID=1123286 RepID=A0ABZ3J5F9_SPOA4|nr:nucleoside recognition domain-containing protein [Sporomusa acidovorans]OZC15368.1 nucleoside recognition [Sporomusa acidovorans DSM 3132]SDF14111.1 Nucleoside recognition [Sporomusa acidovorans]
MTFVESLYQGGLTGLITVGKLALIILPLMVMIEFAKQYGWLEILSQRSNWLTRAFHLPGSAALPALVGLFIGIVSGSGVILQTAKEENFSRETLTVLFVMIAICHSLFEETALFVGLGANILVMAGARLLIALLFSYLVGWVLELQSIKNNPQNPKVF